MSQTETGKHLFENISEEGRLSFNEILLENGRIILWDLQSLKGSISATSSVTGTLSVTWSLKGEVSAVSSVSGTLTGDWALKGSISAVSSVQGILSHAALERGFYYAKLGSTILTGIEKDSFRITEELNKIPSFEFEIANCSDNRTTIAAGITDVFTIYRRITGVDTLMFTGIINGDSIEYLSLERIRITGYASYIDLNWRFHQHLDSEDVETVDTVFDSGAVYTDYTTQANNDTVNDVLLTFGVINHALYIGMNETFFGAQIKYSTKGVQAGSTTVVVEYSQSGVSWATLDVLDETRAFTETEGTYYLIIPHKPSDWAKQTVNSVKRFWIRFRISAGSYTTPPKLDRIKITNVDVYRVYYFETAADTIMTDVLAGTGYSMDVTDVCPSDTISIVAEYETKLRIIAGIANALTWDDSGDKKAYQWWIDTSKKVHFKQKRGATLGDITAELTILNNIEDYFNLSNRLHFFGNYDGLNQLRAVIEDTNSQDTHEIRELAVPEERYNNYIPLKEAAQKAMTYTKAPLQKIAATVTTKYWLDNSFEVGDTVTLHKDTWAVDSTAFQIVRADIGPRVTNLDMGISQEHLDGLKAGLQRQLDITGIRMHGSTSLMQFGPEEMNYQRVDDSTVYPARMKFEIPSETRYIHKITLSWKLGPYRADVIDGEEAEGHDHDGYAGSGGAHDHDGYAGSGGAHDSSVLDGGAHTPTELGTGDHAHAVTVLMSYNTYSGYIINNLYSTYENSHTHSTNTPSVTDHTHTNPVTSAGSQHRHGGGGNTGWESAHTHTNPTTGSESAHTHSGGTTGAGTAHSHTNPTTGTASQNHTHSNPNTGSESAHTHVVALSSYISWANINGFLPAAKEVSSESAHTHTNPTTGSESTHTHTNPTTGSESAHTHPKGRTDGPDDVGNAIVYLNPGSSCVSGSCVASWDNESFAEYTHWHLNTALSTEAGTSHTHTQGATGAGSSHVHTQGATGAGSSHYHTISTSATANAFIKDFSVVAATSGAGSSHVHTQGATGASGISHTHGQGVTGTESVHTHTGGTIGAGSAHTHTQGNTGAGSSHQHAMGLTGYEDEHTHTQGVTGTGGGHNHPNSVTGSGASHHHELSTGQTPGQPKFFAYDPITADGGTSSTTGNHTHTINGVADHPHTAVAIAAHANHVIATQIAHGDHTIVSMAAAAINLAFGIHEIAGGTIMELIVNGETVASNYNGDQTDIVITGYTTTGSNTIEIQPAVGQNHKGGANMDGKGLVFIEAKRF